MKNIFRFIKKSRLAILAIIILLIIQAYCDLALPEYTSDLLNVGLQQNGIEDAVPETIRDESLSKLVIFLSDSDAQCLSSAYGTPDSSGVRRLSDDADREKLNDILLVPESMVIQLESTPDGADSLSRMLSAVRSGDMTSSDIRAQMSEGIQKLEELTDTYLNQIAVGYVSAEYSAQGLDLNDIRNSYLFRVGGKMLVMSLVMAIVAIITGYIASVVSAGVGRDLRARLFEKVMGFTGAEIEKFSTASLITRCTNDIQQVQMLMVMLLRMVTYAPILAIAGVIKVIHTGSQMSWIIVVAVIALAICIGVLFSVAYPKFKIMQDLVDKLNLVSREMLTGIMPIRAFGRQKYEEKRFSAANTDLFKTQLFTNRTMTFMMPAMMFIMNGVSVLIVWVGGHGVDNSTIQVGDLTAFITYSMVIIMSFLMLSMISIMLPRAGVAADRIEEVLETPISLADPEKAYDNNVVNKPGEVVFSDVSFTYPGADDPVLEHISFTAGAGTTTAIIGSTGCGKSTLVHLIPRFYDVTEGSISVCGEDIRRISQKKLRDMIGYVPQKGILFSGTIESNLKYAGDISDEEMVKAAEIAQAVEFISEKRTGYQSPIAQNGSNVSGGQRQRLSIARAIAKRPKIYVFDDAFSALDYKTDAALRTALSSQTKDAAVIIVAQRISTIMNADQILVMEDGKIVGRGTHRELLKSCDTYLEIARGQLSETEIQNALKGGN